MFEGEWVGCSKMGGLERGDLERVDRALWGLRAARQEFQGDLETGLWVSEV